MYKALKPRSKSAGANQKERDYYSLLEIYARTLAPIYDLFFLFISIGAEPKLREEIADNISAPANRILDLATGTGRQAIAFAKRKNEVVGVDLSRDMIGVARKKKRQENLEFTIADATTLPFDKSTFDFSCVSFALHDMIPSVREKAILELARVTKDEGSVLIVDYSVPETSISRLFSRIFTFFEPYYAEFVNFDLERSVIKSGVQIESKIPALYGFGRILKGRKTISHNNGTFF